MIPITNFDFLVGKWSVLNKRLKERMKGATEWIEFTAEMETKKIFNGLIVMDEMKTNHFGENFNGLSIRMLNPDTNEWKIYWADTYHLDQMLQEQVIGKFENGTGEFFGKDIFEGKEIPLRFSWKKETENTAQWEQAYYDVQKKEWETNWIMIFTAIES